jgi:aspartyl-tRNA(Asn)/glutamyl-tRNA(Gln) amidotransferase subunit A
MLTVMADAARERARQADAELARGERRSPLHGIPVAVKDLFRTKGVRTTAGSKLFANYVPDHDAAVVERLAHAGAVLVGKTGMHELAYGITSSNPHFGAVRNPWDRGRIPGGSSGGSGAPWRPAWFSWRWAATREAPFAFPRHSAGRWG